MATNTTFDNPKSSIRSKESRGAGTARLEPQGRSGGMKTPSHEQIAARAKAIWQAKGCPSGQDEQNWREAEAQLRSELSRA